jgi:sarcosine oxidase subunit alpha
MVHVEQVDLMRQVAAVEAELSRMKDVRIMRRTTVFGTYDGGTYGAVERVSDHLATAPLGRPRQRLWRIVAKQAVLASGATERPIVFGGNDRPGVMLAGAVRAYLNRYGVVPGQKAVVFGNNDSAATTVTELDRAGVEVVALVDCRPEPSELISALRARQNALISGGIVTDAIGKKHAPVIIRTRSGEEGSWTAI